MFNGFKCPLCQADMLEVGEFEGTEEQLKTAYLQCQNNAYHRLTAIEVYTLTDTMHARARKLTDKATKYAKAFGASEEKLKQVLREG